MTPAHREIHAHMMGLGWGTHKARMGVQVGDRIASAVIAPHRIASRPIASYAYVHVHVCVRACVRACARARVLARVLARVRVVVVVVVLLWATRDTWSSLGSRLRDAAQPTCAPAAEVGEGR